MSNTKKIKNLELKKRSIELKRTWRINRKNKKTEEIELEKIKEA